MENHSNGEVYSKKYNRITHFSYEWWDFELPTIQRTNRQTSGLHRKILQMLNMQTEKKNAKEYY